MIDRLVASQVALDSPLGRTSPLVKLAVAMTWLGGLVAAVDVRPPLALAIVALCAGLVLGRVPARRLAVGIAPLAAAAIAIGLSNALFAAANGNPDLPAIASIGPWRLTGQGLAGGMALAARVLAIASVGVVFGQTTDSTRLADALVQQAHVSPRFAYGALAAYQAVPRFAEDLATIRQARRIRGLSGSWHPRVLVTLLVQAIRHGDRLALAMDARAFGSGPRSTFRPLRWTIADVGVAIGGVAALVAVLVTLRG